MKPGSEFTSSSPSSSLPLSKEPSLGQNSRRSWRQRRESRLAGRGAARRSERAFTMIEIAISLAVIGFALVAIIGILPTGMQVGRDNREETIINQDLSVFLDAIRNGERGLDDLTHYVYAITNVDTQYGAQGNVLRQDTNGYTYVGSTLNNSPMSPAFPINTGMRIVGLLSRPKYTWTGGVRVPILHSNYVAAYVRSISGGANEKYPQTNPTVQDLGLSYRLALDVVPYASYDRDWTNYTAYLGSRNTNDWQWRSNYWMTARNLQANLYDLRLTFRWPLLPNGGVGNGRQAFRTVAGGQLLEVPPPPGSGFPTRAPDSLPYTLYFFESRNYAKSP
jgi:type II secretory pathway pseudopilin PulG